MINCRGPAGSFFDDRAIEPYGVKLMAISGLLTAALAMFHRDIIQHIMMKSREIFYYFPHPFPGQGRDASGESTPNVY